MGKFTISSHIHSLLTKTPISTQRPRNNNDYPVVVRHNLITKIKSLLRSELFSFYATLAVVFLLIVLKSTSGDGQVSLFNNLLRRYVEESSASITNLSRPQQFSDINSLTALSLNAPGQGGNESTLDPSTVQESSFLANNPSSTDYIESSGFKRSQVLEYIVQEGDSISFIASDYGVSVNSILWANNLRSADNIQLGQDLKIPPVSGVIHKVKKGDTLASIAKKYEVEPDVIMEFNSLPQNGELQIDDELVVPDGKIKSVGVAVANRSAVSTLSKRFSYLPDLGDYFFKPASGFNWGVIHGRNGVDIANSCGTPIYAAADGNVTLADSSGWNGGFGKYVKITHSNGTETVYAHATRLLAETGESVARGQIIANMGTTGRSTGCHLHFEVHGARNPFAKY